MILVQKKLKDVEISVPIVYGNAAFWLGKKASEWVFAKHLKILELQFTCLVCYLDVLIYVWFVLLNA